jgi:hypothetical protein
MAMAPLDRPIPLRPDPDELVEADRRSRHRALASYALAHRDNVTPSTILRRNWPGDSRALAILKAARSPTSTADFPPHDVTAAFRSLAPGWAAWKLFDHAAAMRLLLFGIHTVLIPAVAALSPAPVFVAEGGAAPAVQLGFAETTVGPAKRVLVLAAVTSELQHVSADNATAVIGRILADGSRLRSFSRARSGALGTFGHAKVAQA